MECRYELKPAVMEKGVKYKIIRITDVAFHSSKKTPTPLIGKKVQKSFANNQPGRIYFPPDIRAIFNRREFILNLLGNDPDLVRMVKEEKAKGYKVLLALPNEGVPFIPGKDTVEFMNSKNGKRILRGIAKKKEEK